MCSTSQDCTRSFLGNDSLRCSTPLNFLQRYFLSKAVSGTLKSLHQLSQATHFKVGSLRYQAAFDYRGAYEDNAAQNLSVLVSLRRTKGASNKSCNNKGQPRRARRSTFKTFRRATAHTSNYLVVLHLTSLQSESAPPPLSRCAIEAP